MMSYTTLGGHRRLAATITLVAGGAVAAATWVSGDHSWAIGIAAAFLVLAAVTYIWSGRTGDIAAVLRAGGDERQRGLDRDALALSAQATTVVAVVGAIVQIARTGDPGVFGLFCAVSGVTYAGGLLALRLRR
jgi:hypothetical protein